MSKEIYRVHGEHHTYTIKEDSGWWSTKYYVSRDDGKYMGSYDSRASALRAASAKAGKKPFVEELK